MDPIPETFERRYWLRLIFLLLLGVEIFWLQLEDVNLVRVEVFSLSMAAVAAAAIGIRLPVAWRTRWVFYPGLGLLGGLFVSPLALFVMALKSGLHGHGFPDYTPAQVEQILQLFPIWLAGGLLIGLGLLVWTRRDHHAVSG